jgi:hypothetical protein
MIFLRDEEPEARDIFPLQDAVEFSAAYFLPLVADGRRGDGDHGN